MSTTKPSVTDLQVRIARRTERRLRIGWFDWTSDSWDMRLAGARATRIRMRATGGARPVPSVACLLSGRC
jgi:hypothetical protein